MELSYQPYNYIIPLAAPDNNVAMVIMMPASAEKRDTRKLPAVLWSVKHPKII